jgi:hypothetical protein
MAQDGGSIGLYASQEGSSCDISLALYTPTEFYVLAKPNVANTAGGVNGAEFVIRGAPTSGIIFSATPGPGSTLALGNPIADESQPDGSKGVANIGFGSCVAPDAMGVVLLYTISATDISGVADLEMTVSKGDPPSNPTLADCPLINACDAPFFTAHCVLGGKGYFNHSSPSDCLPVAVQNKTWGEVKSLYN